MLGGVINLAVGGGRSSQGGFAVRRGPQRSRRAVLVRAGSGVLTLLVLATAAWWTLTSSFFAVTRIESGAYRFTSEAELEGVFNEFLGRNIWTLSTDEVAERINQLPWIRDLRVLRRLPNSIEVDFREWTPVLMVEAVKVDGRLRDRLVLTKEGRVLDFPTELVLPGLPVLVGLPPVREGEEAVLRLPAEQSGQLMELISSMEDAGLEAANPVDFVVARPEGFAIVLQNRQGTVLLGREDFGPRLKRYMMARDHMDPGLDYDLRFEHLITVSGNE